jgi:hypothetical protein
MRIVYLVLALALLAGCKPTPTKLADQIVDADRIIATYYHHSAPPGKSSFGVTITGDDVRKIVTAISHSTSGGMESLCAPSWELQFYKGTNRLATVGCGCSLVWVDVVEFSDASGTLEKLDRAIEAQTHRIPVPTNGTIGALQSY